MIFITGSTGIVGTRLAFDLAKRGVAVRGLKRPTSDMAFVEKCFNFYDPAHGSELFATVEWVDGDILDFDALLALMENVDYVYHAAAMVSYQKKDEENLMRTNVDGTENVVNAALESGVKKLCHVSSIAALGTAKKGKATNETHDWKRDENRSIYGLSKFMAEREVWRGIAEGLPSIIVNPTIILGPAKPAQSSGQLMQLLGKGVSVYPNGGTGFVDVRNVCEACIQLMDNSVSNERFVLNSQNLKYRNLLAIAAGVFGNRKPRFGIAEWALKLGALFSAKITLETARSASRILEYDASKIKTFTDLDFVPVRDSLEDYRAFFA